MKRGKSSSSADDGVSSCSGESTSETQRVYDEYSTDDEDGVPRRAASTFCFGSQLESAPCMQREIVKLSNQQVQKIGEDLIGVANRVDVPNSSVAELQLEIQRLVSSGTFGTDAYQLACRLDPEFANSRRLKLAFLRSVEGSAKRAAKRYVRHFATKLELFGRDKLCKDIELSDLDEYDMEALESGGFQVLREKDRAGRPILFGRYTCMKYRSVPNMVRALWYVWSSIIEDDEAQTSGIVAIGFENGKTPLERFECQSLLGGAAASYDLYATSSDGGFDRDLARGILSLPLSLPIRPVGYHICADNSQWKGISDMVSVTLCKFVRLRLRFHYGTTQEAKYQLMTNGVPVDSIPVKNDGEIDLTYHMEWIENRRLLEESRSNYGDQIDPDVDLDG
ncbi:hypothetical protein IV203_020764 [Nitzschia inconspicua]|uniref:Uncharacterized protein n=1 Tax=Nitzschia inconspicua TaxID=303405 RepID=A0A9K3PDC4_9STRA|nr:hypothetical protein IV203_020764 [Nitzschia inconspicua]